MITFSLLQKGARYFSTSSYQSKTPIPGLHVYPNFLHREEEVNLRERSIALHRSIWNRVPDSPSQKCITYISQQKQEDKKESLRVIKIDDGLHKKITGQYFKEYGGKGHTLTYFIGKDNLPEFVKTDLIARVLEIPEVIALRQNQILNWNFAFNTYEMNSSSEMAGFDFHKDVSSNGEVTMIYSIGAESIFGIRHPNDKSKVWTTPLLSNTLVLLSNEARWDYEHSVMPVTVDNDEPFLIDDIEKIRRMSLVIGFTKQGI